MFLAERLAAITHASAQSGTSGTRRIIHFGISTRATDVPCAHNRLYRLDRLCNRINASERAFAQTGTVTICANPRSPTGYTQKRAICPRNYRKSFAAPESNLRLKGIHSTTAIFALVNAPLPLHGRPLLRTQH